MNQEMQPVAIIDKADPAQSDPSHQTGSKQSFLEQPNDGSGGMLAEDRTAVAALVQLHGSNSQVPHLPYCTQGSIERPQPMNRTHDMSNFYNRATLYQSRSEPGIQQQSTFNDRPLACNTSNSNPVPYNTNLQDTVVNLSNAVSTMQQQQAVAYERQESLSNTLHHLTSILQDMRNGPVPSNVNYNNTATGTYDRSALQRTHRRQEAGEVTSAQYSSNHDGFENSYCRVSESQSLPENSVSQWQDRYFPNRNSYTQQYEGTENSALSNAPRGRYSQRLQQVGPPNNTLTYLHLMAVKNEKSGSTDSRL
ncbi:MAG: hypothetical protein N0E59_07265 [Candidatus Thiodiazotropha taylori]|nr:hypothetical protein [Candidatus Thiodiazotropha taylori]MCW4282892.1 hypothetical protein [Candidatus Thiodiazotropha taylori]